MIYKISNINDGSNGNKYSDIDPYGEEFWGDEFTDEVSVHRLERSVRALLTTLCLFIYDDIFYKNKITNYDFDISNGYVMYLEGNYDIDNFVSDVDLDMLNDKNLMYVYFTYGGKKFYMFPVIYKDVKVIGGFSDGRELRLKVYNNVDSSVEYTVHKYLTKYFIKPFKKFIKKYNVFTNPRRNDILMKIYSIIDVHN
jgi:hypothetical protein